MRKVFAPNANLVSSRIGKLLKETGKENIGEIFLTIIQSLSKKNHHLIVPFLTVQGCPTRLKRICHRFAATEAKSMEKLGLLPFPADTAAARSVLNMLLAALRTNQLYSTYLAKWAPMVLRQPRRSWPQAVLMKKI
jgi:hypothetical protein